MNEIYCFNYLCKSSLFLQKKTLTHNGKMLLLDFLFENKGIFVLTVIHKCFELIIKALENHF